MKYDYANLEYTVSGRTGFTLTQALKLWRAKYDDIKIAYDKYVNLYDENQQVIKDLQKIISSAGIVKVNLLFKVLHYLHLI